MIGLEADFKRESAFFLQKRVVNRESLKQVCRSWASAGGYFETQASVT